MRASWPESVFDDYEKRNLVTVKYFASEEIHFSRALKRWGRRRGMRFEILDTPIQTSMRKMEWFSVGELLRMVAQTLFAPAGMRKRASCDLWYKRPELKTGVIKQQASSSQHR